MTNNSKHRSDESVVAGKVAVVIDDSIVRGDALEVANRVLKNARVLKDTGASQVHARIGCPPIHYPCFMGVDTPNPEKLLANRVSAPIEEGIAKFTGVDSVSYLTPRELLRAVVGEDIELPEVAAYKHHGYCGACFLGEYPVPIAGSFGKKIYART
jgi:amidophosphoribosyltransferase